MEHSAEDGSSLFSAIDAHLVCSLATICGGVSYESITSLVICLQLHKKPDTQPDGGWKTGSLWILSTVRTTCVHFFFFFWKTLKRTSLCRQHVINLNKNKQLSLKRNNSSPLVNHGAPSWCHSDPLYNPQCPSPYAAPLHLQRPAWFTVLNMFSSALLS